MITNIGRPIRDRASAEAGYSLIELLVAMGITTMIMGVTMAGLSDAMRANDTVVQITSMNNGLRAGLDMMVRDLLQAGAGLPKGNIILTPSGAALVRRPGPPGTAYTNAAADLNMPAVIPGAGLGPIINGTATDTITILTADNNFTDVGLVAVTSTSVDVDPTLDIGAGPDRVIVGQLMMIYKGSTTTLVQVTAVDTNARRITFATGDSLRLNQTGTGVVGNLQSLNAQAPTGAAAPAATRITRIRMISYYLDNTTNPDVPRLVRRINNGHHIDFDNELGTAVAIDIENLRFTYDLTDGVTNASGVRFVPDDLTTGGACAPDECFPTQIRKVNVTLTGRSQNALLPQARVYRNTLSSQVALRSMALVNEYQD